MGVDDSSYVVLTHDDVLAHPITRDLSAALVLGIARSVTPIEGTDGITLQRILETSEEAWAETRIAEFPDVQPDEDELVGSIGVMVVATIEDPSVIDVKGRDATGQAENIRRRLFDWFGAQFGQEPESLDETKRLRDDLGAGDRDIEASLQAVEEIFGVSLLEGRTLQDFQTIGDVAAALTAGSVGRFDPEAALNEAVPSSFTPVAGGRLVVVGDADFATNALMEFGNNQDLFLNTIAWLAQEERQIGERPSEGEKLTLTGYGEGLICLVSLGVVPGSAILIAVLLLFRRRYL